MPESKTNRDGWMKKETTLVIAFVALVIGFMGGVAFSVYRTNTGTAEMDPAVQQRESELAARIFTLTEQLKENPDNARQWTELGNLYFDLHEPDKAVQAYQEALRIEPGNADVWTDLGVMYRRSGQSDKAIEAFDKAIATNPKHEISRLNKGIVLLHDFDDSQGAVRAWEELLAINPVAVAPNGQTVEELVRNFKNDTKGGS